MSKFKSMLVNTAQGIKEKRAAIIVSSTKNKQQALINNIQDQINEKELALQTLTDVAPENTYSLKPGGNNFDPAKWVLELQEVKMEILQLKIELEIAEETFEEWFIEE